MSLHDLKHMVNGGRDRFVQGVYAAVEALRIYRVVPRMHAAIRSVRQRVVVSLAIRIAGEHHFFGKVVGEKNASFCLLK